jgi:hypothetical protein
MSRRSNNWPGDPAFATFEQCLVMSDNPCYELHERSESRGGAHIAMREQPQLQIRGELPSRRGNKQLKRAMFLSASRRPFIRLFRGTTLFPAKRH